MGNVQRGNVLVIAYYFPPLGGAGTQRATKFCKYLSKSGWRPTVLTREISSEQRTRWEPEDPSLLDEIGASTRVVRAASGAKPPRWVSELPDIDSARNWLGPAYDAALQIAREDNIRAIFVTMSPFDLSLLGLRLQEELGVPVILDLRDPWALDGWRVYGKKSLWHQDFAVMSSTLPRAAGVVANTPATRDALLDAIPDLRPSSVRVITNGFDASDFERPIERPSMMEDGKFHLVHTGTFHSYILYKYRGIRGRLQELRHYRPETMVPSGRTPLHLLHAVEALKRKGHPLINRLKIIFAGVPDIGTQKLIDASEVGDLVTFTGYLNHETSVSLLRCADALFLPLHDLPAGQSSLIVPGKAYEYLAARRPILGCLPPGDARNWVEQSGLGYCSSPCDAREIENALVRIENDEAQVPRKLASEEWLDQFSRRTLTRALSNFLDTVTSKRDG